MFLKRCDLSHLVNTENVFENLLYLRKYSIVLMIIAPPEDYLHMPLVIE